ncbi:CP-type G domain-containing protein [Forsythia ovata]|uniref:CP-type G domain-containing protein n=1 Tax=Forsythia ovata TaxID=205694 RepID=A0ABD1W770_9LAMI
MDKKNTHALAPGASAYEAKEALLKEMGEGQRGSLALKTFDTNGGNFERDTVDFNGSFLAHVRDLAGANPMILVVTKVDLLPKRTALNCVGDWVVEATMKKRLK